MVKNDASQKLLPDAIVKKERKKDVDAICYLHNANHQKKLRHLEASASKTVEDLPVAAVLHPQGWKNESWTHEVA